MNTREKDRCFFCVNLRGDIAVLLTFEKKIISSGRISRAFRRNVSNGSVLQKYSQKGLHPIPGMLIR